MQEIRVDFNPTLELVSVRIGDIGFLVKPNSILDGESSIFDRLKNSRNANPEAAEVTDEELQVGASLLINTPGVADWAKSKFQYEYKN